MRFVWSMIVSKTAYPKLYAFADANAQRAKLLYNAALFRIRQVFFGWDKEPADRHPLEQKVFAEVEQMKALYPKLNVRRVLSCRALEKILRVTENPDFFSGLPAHTAQATVKQACQDFSNWLKACKAYKKNPAAFLGKPKMPKYCRTDRRTFAVSNQEAVLYLREDDCSCADLKLPGFSKTERIPLRGVPCGTLKQLTVKPYYGKYILLFSFKDGAYTPCPELPNFAGVDFGTDNLAAIACTDSSSAVCKGGAVLSANRLFAKKKAQAVSCIMSGHEHKGAKSAHLSRLSLKHACFMDDMMHKVSTFIIRWCIRHSVGTLVLGVNPLWKQKVNIGRQNNQNFVSIPHARLRKMIEYKAAVAGIIVIEQEESYTSKADITAEDPIPVYGQETGRPVFSGGRVKRGLYQTSAGYQINADCNGAANILRKACHDVWKDTKDFRFLAVPESVGFHKLNHSFA